MRSAGVDPERDLDALACFAWLFEGVSLPLESATLESVHHDGRPDSADESTADVRRAVEALQRLDELLARSCGERRVLVLLYAYFWNGPDARGQWDRQGGFTARLGLTFATAAQRQAWLLHPSRKIGQAAAAEHGARLLEEAVSAYEDLPPPSANPSRPRLALARVRDVLSRQVCAVTTDIKELTAARERRRMNARSRAVVTHAVATGDVVESAVEGVGR